MAISREKKKEILGGLQRVIRDSASLVFVNFHGLHSKDTALLRKGLREKGVSYTVAKKTLIKKALEDTRDAGALPELSGEVGIAYGDDTLAPARELWQFSKTRKDALRILGGLFEGSFRDAGSMIEIASIPGKEILYGKLAFLIQSPLAGLVVALDQIAQKKDNN